MLATVRVRHLRNVLAFGIALALMRSFEGSPAVAQTATQISETDAKILVYLSPLADTVRAAGGDIVMELSPPSKELGNDFFYYRMGDYKSKSPSNLVGFSAVNKYTAQVWDTDGHVEVSDAVLRGVQAIIRKANHIDARVMTQYGRLKPPV